MIAGTSQAGLAKMRQFALTLLARLDNGLSAIAGGTR